MPKSKQGKMKGTKKDKHIFVDTSSSKSSVSPCSSSSSQPKPDSSHVEVEVEECNHLFWNNILREILEVVLEKLIEHKDDSSTQTILNCRLINKHWKCIAESVMETTCLSNFDKVCKFELSSHSGLPYDEGLSSFIPSLKVVPIYGDLYGTHLLEKVSCPPFLLDDIGEGAPFPSKSVIFKANEKDNRGSSSSSKRDFHPVSVFKLVGNIGKNLSSAVFYKVTFTSPYFAKVLLDELTNLKALLLSQVTLMSVGDADFERIYKLAPLPHLKILKLHLNYVESKVCKHSESERGETFNPWLTQAYGRTLTHLEIDEAENFSLNQDNFVNLQVLSMFDVGNFTLQNSETLPNLQRFSVFYLSDAGGDILFEDYRNFLEKFGATIVYLKLQLWVDDVKSEERDFGAKIITTFPNLKELWYPFPRSRKDVAVLMYFLKRFPKLKELSFSWCSGIGMEVVDWEDLWRVCPELKKIHLYSNSNDHEEAIQVMYRKTKSE